MRIDAHMHVNYQGYSGEDIINYLDNNQFDCCWLMTWEEVDHGKWNYEHLSIEDVYETYLCYPSRIIPMYAPDPLQEDAPKKLRYWCEKGVKGCAELKATINWKSPNLKRLLAVVSELKLPVLFHMEESSEILTSLESDTIFETYLLKLMRSNRLLGLPKRFFNILVDYCDFLMKWRKKRTYIFPGYMLDFTSLGLILDEYPNINFIGHGPLFWKHFLVDTSSDDFSCPKEKGKPERLTCEFLRHYPNLYGDISANSGYEALNDNPIFSKKFISEFSHKLVFGTDNTILGHEELLKSFNLDSGIMKQLLGENALYLLNNQKI